MTEEMKLRPAIYFSVVSIGIAFLTFQAFRPTQPDPEKDAAILKGVLAKINRFHYAPRTLDDQFSEQVYGLYLEDIDRSRRFLTAEDVAKLEPFKKKLDDETNASTFEFFNLSSSLLDVSLVKTQAFYKEMLVAPMDFSKDESIVLDEEKRGWLKNDAELKAYWKKLMKYEVLSRLHQKLEEQAKPEFKGEKKSQADLEKDVRKNVLDIYEKWFKRLQKTDRDDRLEVYLNAIAGVYDPHTNYWMPKDKENFDIQMSGKLEGIGARLTSDGEKTSVSEIVPGTPSWKQGELKAKDVILKIGQGEAEAVDVQGWDLDDVVKLVRGPKGSEVRLTIQKNGDGDIKEIRLIRDVVIMEEGFAKSLILFGDQAKTEKIGYIYLPKFYADFTPQGATSCAVDVAKEIEKLKAENVKGIVFDMRGNSGGSLRDVVQMSGLFIEQGPIVQVKSRNRQPEVMEDIDARVQWAGPLVVMQNFFSASASEILSAAMQDYGRAIVVGTDSHGKGTVQRFYPVDERQPEEMGSVKISMQKFFRVNGGATQLKGVSPDIVLPDSYELLKTGERNEKYPLEWSEIEAASFKQNVYEIHNLPAISVASLERVAKNATFQKIRENAKMLKSREDRDEWPLSLEKYQKFSRDLKKESDQFEDMFKPIEGFELTNLSVDLPHIQSDTSRSARNDEWLKGRRKDVQLFETVQIMRDLIRLDGVAQKN